ncbi:hypothetical protein VTP01DRAFT_6009 [Rhizomucor pusillus]|uniref:uncharacterized protein n=1 Tax=Rhizomucor pusillus TaxID=4840 RepID=UPI0037423CA5
MDPKSIKTTRYLYSNQADGRRSEVMELVPTPTKLAGKEFRKNGAFLLKAVLAIIVINTVLHFFKDN